MTQFHQRLRYIPIIVSVVAPAVAIAQTPINTQITNIKSTLNTVIGLLFIIATLIFLWGVIKFVTAQSDEKKKGEGKSIMTWGIIGLAVMASVWGIANILINYFGTSAGNAIPNFPSQVTP